MSMGREGVSPTKNVNGKKAFGINKMGPKNEWDERMKIWRNPKSSESALGGLVNSYFP